MTRGARQRFADDDGNCGSGSRSHSPARKHSVSHCGGVALRKHHASYCGGVAVANTSHCVGFAVTNTTLHIVAGSLSQIPRFTLCQVRGRIHLCETPRFALWRVRGRIHSRETPRFALCQWFTVSTQFRAHAPFSSGTPERPSPRLQYIRSACADNKMNDSQMEEVDGSPSGPESPKNCWYDELYPLGLPVAQASLSTCPVSLRSTGPVSLRSTVGQASRSTCGSGFPERLRKIDTIQNQCRWLRGVESLEPQKGSGRASEQYERVVWMRKGSDARRRRPPSGPRQEAASADRSCVPRHGRVLVQPVCFITVPVC